MTGVQWAGRLPTPPPPPTTSAWLLIRQPWRGGVLATGHFTFQHFKWIRIRIRIQGFDEQKYKKYSWIIFLKIKNCNFLIRRPPQRASQLQEKPSAPKREHPAIQKMKFINFFLFLWVIYAILEPNQVPDLGTSLYPNPTRIRIRIHNTGIKHGHI